MLYIALSAIAVLSFLVISDRRAFQQERRDWTGERRLLLTRIQSPHTISPEIPDDAPTPEAVIPDDDASYWAARGMSEDGSWLN